MTQSEYVKGELIHLRKSLQDLEDRAGNIETDIRNAMSEGSAANLTYCVDIHSCTLEWLSRFVCVCVCVCVCRR